MEASSPQQQLAWEARWRMSAAAAAAIAAFFTLAGAVGTGILFGGSPSAGVAASLERAAEPGPIGGQPSLRVPFFEFYRDHGPQILGFSLLRFFGLLALGWALTYLAKATHARRPEMPRFVVYIPAAGAVFSAVAALMYDIAFRTSIGSFLDGARTVDAARDVSSDSAIMVAQILGLPGALGLAIGFVLVALNAMRAGLLTRFMGVLGIIVGVLIIFPIGSPLPIVQCFWLAAFALLVAGRSPNGMPPAWHTGRAEPWPTSAEVREARARKMQERGGGRRGAGGREEPESAEVAAVSGGPERPSARRRKRKRRG